MFERTGESSGGLLVLAMGDVPVIPLLREVDVAREGMAAARMTLSRRSWRTALRCLRWSLSRRVTFDAFRTWSCVRGVGEAAREGRRMARRRELGIGPIVDEKLDITAEMGGVL